MQNPEISKSLVICLTAFNYIYAQFDKNIGKHDVLCTSEELANWIKVNYKYKISDIYVVEFRNKIFLKNHFTNDENKDLLNQLRKNNYQQYYLSFISGWLMNWLQKKIGLVLNKCIITDDGISNLIIQPTNNYYLKQILAFVISGKQKSFSKYRDFNSRHAKKIITIYSDLPINKLNLPKETIDIKNNVKNLCFQNRESNNPLLSKEYGIYITSDRGVYNKNHSQIVENISTQIKKLEDKTQVNWIIKTKATDPLNQNYLEKGLHVASHKINQELMLDRNLKFACTNYDTFLLNSVLLQFPIKCFVRNHEPTYFMHKEKVNVIKPLLQKCKNVNEFNF